MCSEINTALLFPQVTNAMHEMDGKLPQDVEACKSPKIIGGLPIAEYEGSPRRYGPRHLETNQNANHPLLPSAHSLLASPSVYPPRPGFPQVRYRYGLQSENCAREKRFNEFFPLFQRIVPATNVVDQSSANKPSSTSTSPNQTTTNSTFDYLYEFSETRKVLEEFFKQTDNTASDFQVGALRLPAAFPNG